MPWCPICKNEYRDGYTMCAECKVELVGSLEEAEATEEENMDFDELDADEIVDDLEDSDTWDTAAVDVLETSNIVMEKESYESKPESVYEDKHHRAEEYKSSAQALLIVGVVGGLALILNATGIVPFMSNLSNALMINGVLGALFVLFIVLGIYSISQSKKLAALAKEDDKLKEEIKQYLITEFPKEKLEMEVSSEETGEEQLYFARTAFMKKAVFAQFTEADEALIEKMTDDYYEELFS